MHAGEIRKVLYGLCNCTKDNPLAKAQDYFYFVT